MRTNYSPYLSGQSKELIRARNSWKKVAVSQGYGSAEKIAKDLSKEIKKAVDKDKKTYFNRDFGENCDQSNAWKTVKVILGINDNLSPTEIRLKDQGEEYSRSQILRDWPKLLTN